MCIVTGCSSPNVGRGYCRKHYQRFRTYGDPLKTTRTAPGTFTACTVEGCAGKPICKGFCNKHYTRYAKHGDPTFACFVPAPDGEPQRWLREVALQFQQDECLPYPFARANGYGQVWISGQKWSAHRYVCVATHGDPPSEGMAAAHECGNSTCVNPRHLSWKTYSENSADQVRHGTRLLGERTPRAKLTEAKVRQIREEQGTHESIAATYGVSRRAITFVLSGKTWGHVK